MTKRGFTQQEAMDYVGVKRRTWEQRWLPRLVGIPQGVSLIFDRQDLDRVFEEFKREAAGQPAAANDSSTPAVQNGQRNGWPEQEKGRISWARNQCRASTPTTTQRGKSIDSGKRLDFASAASQVMKKRKAG